MHHQVVPPHGLENGSIAGAPVRSSVAGRMRRRPRLGGLLNYYDRAAWNEVHEKGGEKSRRPFELRSPTEI